MTTDKLLKGMDERTNSQADNLYLEMLYYQFGRYVLISSSREGWRRHENKATAGMMTC